MITTVTLNASIDKAYYMEEKLKNGTVMRVHRVRNSAGGKGLNVARVVRLCGEKVLATGMAGGYNGQYLENLLDKDNIPHNFLHVEGETRSCINILDREYGSTEYLEPGFEVDESTAEEFLHLFSYITKESHVITLSGSVPKGLPKDIYSRIIRQAKDEGKQVILDTSRELLKKGMKARPDMIKPNREELEVLLGVTIHTIGDCVSMAGKLYSQGIPRVVISLGGAGALLACEEGIFMARPPKLPAVNTVGCGDSMVGAFAVAMERRMSHPDALRYAVSVASANALSPNTGDFAPDVRETIEKQVIIERLSQMQGGKESCRW